MQEKNQTAQPRPIALPCLRGSFGDWTYYVALMKLGDMENRLHRADEIHSHTGLKDMLQRAITKRSKEIANYLQSQPQRFFNAIIVGIYDGKPEWYDIGIEATNAVPEQELEDDIRGSVGVLKLSGCERIFAIDGQHRLEGIKEALLNGCSIAEDEQTVIFVAHRDTEEGIKRTRRLFATLNRYAKPVSPMEIIALDEDDGIAITTRELLEQNKLLKVPNVVLVKKSKSVPNSNNQCLTSIQTLYEFLDLILLSDISGKRRNDFKMLRPSDDVLTSLYREAETVISAMTQFIPAISQYASTAEAETPTSPRTPYGGNLLFRPAGLLSFGRAIRQLLLCGKKIEEAIESLSNLNFDLDSEPWKGVLWETGLGRMINRKGNQELAAKLMLYLSGHDLALFGYTEARLTTDYASLINRKDATLPKSNSR